MIVWPATLPQRMSVQGFQATTGEGRLRSQNDAGGAKVRRRFSYAPHTVGCSFEASPEQVAIFDDFVEATLKGGTLPFQMPAPLPVWQQLNGTWVVQMGEGMPRKNPIGGLRWTVTMQLVVLP
ncbi:hypothetical protein [Mangrovibrevibacter kandeliae]|uniref:hypothetical protein n=1 Tax=Mangrovibrevibacter kandeliae TaxID=2968473 RepID=UPI002117C133|nr:hypothetical protein [Aurantimonas sp. CSK15Z-1]MCQ8781726.1 hypothetical protein [Aurantimonas sp. CSK15Z-1]